jgi:hypothetical protein
LRWPQNLRKLDFRFMALARIYSRHPEQATALCRDLERQGYEVEVLSPEETPDTPADLEIQYEICDVDNALQRALDLAAESHADVAVASGALPVTATETEDAAREVQERGVPTAWNQAEDQAAAGAAGPLLQPDAQAPSPTSFPARLREARVGERLAKTWSQTRSAVAPAFSRFVAGLRGLGSWAVRKIGEQRERSAIRAGENRVIREEQLLERAFRRAEAEHRSRQMEAARRAAAVYLSELHHRSAAKPENHPSAEHLAAPPSSNDGQEDTKRMRSRRTKAVAAAAAAAGVCFALVLGIALLRSRPDQMPPASPTPAVNARTAPATAHPSASRPSPVIRKSAQQPSTIHPGRASARRDATTRRDDGNVADDVVVRHFSSSKSLETRVSNGVKHYSDLPN